MTRTPASGRPLSWSAPQPVALKSGLAETTLVEVMAGEALGGNAREPRVLVLDVPVALSAVPQTVDVCGSRTRF